MGMGSPPQKQTVLRKIFFAQVDLNDIGILFFSINVPSSTVIYRKCFRYLPNSIPWKRGLIVERDSGIGCWMLVGEGWGVWHPPPSFRRHTWIHPGTMGFGGGRGELGFIARVLSQTEG